jgi:hypothetical protein
MTTSAVDLIKTIVALADEKQARQTGLFEGPRDVVGIEIGGVDQER